MSELTVPLGVGYELAWLRAQLNPRGIGVLYDPSSGRWMAVWGSKGYAEAYSARELRSRCT